MKKIQTLRKKLQLASGSAAVSLAIVLFASSVARANDPNITITPVINQFPHVILGTSTPPATFTIRNISGSNIQLGAVTLGGTHASEFAVLTDNCSSLLLTPSLQCAIDVRYQPTSFGSKMAMLQVNTDLTSTTPVLVAFLSNDEDDAKEAERRLPPVLFGMNIPETMDRSTGYTLDWSILGYHDTYESVIALFDCTGKAAGTCGANFAENFANSGLITPTSTMSQPLWTFNGEAAVEHQYSYSFNANTESFPQVSTGNYEIVVRFYRKNNMDVMSGEASLSLLVPGSVTSEYYDKEGRRVTKYISVP